jgi:succinoglycan biosynthesis protein ExoO
MQPDATFVIAAYNAEATIARAVHSALDQNGVMVEVVIVDDMSSDRTGEIAHSLAGENVRVVSLKENRGPGGARNVGLAEATGRWIAVLDSDDAVHPDRLNRMIARAEVLGAQIAVDNIEVVEETTGDRHTMFAEDFLRDCSDITLAQFIRSNAIFRTTFNFGYMKPILERAFLNRHGLRYDETLRIGEDYLFLASALANGARCVVEPAAGYVYHVRDGSVSRVLEAGHVTAMMAADAAFEHAHHLDRAAREALAERTRSLEEAASFLSLVQHLKSKAPIKALGAALRDPMALRLLRMPVGARLRRLGGSLAWKKRVVRSRSQPT